MIFLLFTLSLSVPPELWCNQAACSQLTNSTDPFCSDVIYFPGDEVQVIPCSWCPPCYPIGIPDPLCTEAWCPFHCISYEDWLLGRWNDSQYYHEDLRAPPYLSCATGCSNVAQDSDGNYYCSEDTPPCNGTNATVCSSCPADCPIRKPANSLLDLDEHCYATAADTVDCDSHCPSSCPYPCGFNCYSTFTPAYTNYSLCPAPEPCLTALECPDSWSCCEYVCRFTGALSITPCTNSTIPCSFTEEVMGVEVLPGETPSWTCLALRFCTHSVTFGDRTYCVPFDGTLYSTASEATCYGLYGSTDTPYIIDGEGLAATYDGPITHLVPGQDLQCGETCDIMYSFGTSVWCSSVVSASNPTVATCSSCGASCVYSLPYGLRPNERCSPAWNVEPSNLDPPTCCLYSQCPNEYLGLCVSMNTSLYLNISNATCLGECPLSTPSLDATTGLCVLSSAMPYTYALCPSACENLISVGFDVICSSETDLDSFADATCSLCSGGCRYMAPAYYGYSHGCVSTSHVSLLTSPLTWLSCYSDGDLLTTAQIIGLTIGCVAFVVLVVVVWYFVKHPTDPASIEMAVFPTALSRPYERVSTAAL